MPREDRYTRPIHFTSFGCSILTSIASGSCAGAVETGFDFHTIDGERYWDERAYYAFTLDEIERQIEGPTGEIDAMCLELVGHAVDDLDGMVEVTLALLDEARAS